MSVGIVLPDSSLDHLKDVVVGRATTIPRARAMTLLSNFAFPEKDRFYASLLEDQSETPRIRRLAAMCLERVQTPAALASLIKNTQIRDEEVLSAVLMALGRRGNQAALEAILRVEDKVTAFIATQARFAAALVSHRLGLPGNDLPFPDSKEFLEPTTRDVSPIQINLAGESEAEMSLRALDRVLLEIEFARECIYQVRCERVIHMVAFNQDFTGANDFKKLIQRKALLAVVTTRSAESKAHYVTWLVLTSPVKQANAFQILISRPDGQLIFGGTGRITERNAEFSIRAVARPGGNPVQLEGTFNDCKLEIKAGFFAKAGLKRRQPKRLPKPGSSSVA